jgi:hypothetical protein
MKLGKLYATASPLGIKLSSLESFSVMAPRQRRLNDYFEFPPKPRSSRTSFLNLPSEIRCRIYLKADLADNYEIDLNYGKEKIMPEQESSELVVSPVEEERIWLGPMYPSSFDGIEQEEQGCFAARSLLLVSRLVSAEFLSLVFSRNHFVIARRNPGGFQPFHDLSQKAVGSLTSIMVSVNACSCLVGHCCAAVQGPYCRGPYAVELTGGCIHDKPLGKKSYERKIGITEWLRLLIRLVALAPLSELTLYLIFDTKDFETAEEAVEPLLKLPAGALRDCTIRLSHEPSRRLQLPAKKCVVHLTDRSLRYTKTPFRFLDLPQEIQLKILSYTSLVAPCELRYNPDRSTSH